MKTTLIIADNHPIVIAGLEYVFRKNDSIALVGVAKDPADLRRLLQTTDCDVLITEYAMLGAQHSEVHEMLSILRHRHPSLEIIVFTSSKNARLVDKFLGHELYAVIEKSRNVRHLLESVESICRRKSVRHSTRDSAAPRESSARYFASKKLSPRELETIRLYASGLTISEISRLVNRSKKTISGHKMSAMRKLGINRNVDILKLDLESDPINGEG